MKQGNLHILNIQCWCSAKVPHSGVYCGNQGIKESRNQGIKESRNQYRFLLSPKPVNISQKLIILLKIYKANYCTVKRNHIQADPPVYIRLTC